MRRPSLVIVSGHPGAGKTTLAHALARRIGCPAVCRDEIKEGIVHTEGGAAPEWGGPIAKHTFETFFAMIRLLLDRGVTVVAEAAFQHRLWAPDVEPLIDVADVRVAHCAVPPDIARRRLEQRLVDDSVVRAAHPDVLLLKALDSGEMRLDDFDPIALELPSITVDTSDGYTPSLDEIVAFLSGDTPEPPGVSGR